MAKRKIEKETEAPNSESYDIVQTASYKSWVSILKQRSDILTKPNEFYIGMSLNNEAGLRKWLLDLCGDAQGRVLNDSGITCAARIPQAEIKVKDCIRKFAELQAQAKAEGRSISTRPPEQLESAWGKAVAALTIFRQEERAIKDKLADLASAEVKTDDEDVLKFGPVGNGHIGNPPDSPGGRLIDLDGQHIVLNSKNELIIRDRRSPYSGMRVEDYKRYIVRPFLHRNRNRRMTLVKTKLPAWPDGVEKAL
jgi:hypothetical protein